VSVVRVSHEALFQYLGASCDVNLVEY
jgi:hypothetical protein